MNPISKRDLLLKMLPGFIPLLVFILVDEIYGSKPALIFAIISGIFSFVWYLIKDRRTDYFILLDTLLVTILGVISIISDNEIFFKLKPAFIGVVMCVILGLSAFSPLNYILGMSKRYFGQMEFSDEQTKQLRRSLRGMFYVFVVYTILVFYSALYMSKEAWAFISGGLFYIVIVAYFGYEYIRNRFLMHKTRNEEWLPLVDMDGKITGKALRSLCHTNKDLLHPVVHMHVFDNNGNLYLQKRSMHKLVQPGKWDTAVGGHISFGEDLMQSLKREAREEIGLIGFNPLLITKYKWVSDIESELVYVFIAIAKGQLLTRNSEIDEARFWSMEQLRQSLGKGILTQNFEFEFQKIIQTPDFKNAIKKAASERLS
jgi:isopentenyldiphosphate isomerase/intracellular septation protein A